MPIVPEIRKIHPSNDVTRKQVLDLPRADTFCNGTLIKKNFVKPRHDLFSNLHLADAAFTWNRGGLISNPDSLKVYLNEMITVWRALQTGPVIQSARVKPLKSTAVNASDLRNVFIERARHRGKAFAFTKWKEAFLERCLEKRLDHYHASNFARRIILRLKDVFAQQRQRDLYNNETADLKFISKFFDSWKNVADIQLEKKYHAIAINYQRRFFERWRAYLETAERKKNLYKFHLKAYYRRKIRAALRKWCEISYQNDHVRTFQNYILKRRVMI